MVTANELWSRKRLTCSTDSPASRRSLAAEWRKMWTPAGGSPANLMMWDQTVIQRGAVIFKYQKARSGGLLVRACPPMAREG